jgi:hypothetical protein
MHSRAFLKSCSFGRRQTRVAGLLRGSSSEAFRLSRNGFFPSREAEALCSKHIRPWWDVRLRHRGVPSVSSRPFQRRNLVAIKATALTVQASYAATLCFGLRSSPNSISHSLTFAPMTSGWSSCK